MIPDTQFFPSTHQIGDLIPMGDQGDLVTMPNGEQRLMTGKVASAADFPDAAVEEVTKVTGIAAAFPSGAVLQCASNGSGSIVAAVGVPNITQSQDFGATWASTSPGASGVNCSGVTWTGSVFLVGVALASSMSFRESPNGASGWGSAGTVSSVSATNNSLRGAYNGTIAFFVGCGTVDAAATINAAGTTVTKRTLPASLGGSNPLIATIAGLFVFGVGSTTYYTTPDGVSFTTRTAPFSFNYMAATSSLLAIYAPSGGQFATTSDGVNWTVHSGPSGFGNNRSALTADADRFYISGSYSTTRSVPWLRWSTDGTSWTNRWLTSAPVANGAWGMCSGRVLYPMIEAGTSVLRVADFDAADYVGVSQLYTTGETGGTGDSTSAIYYVKVGES